MIDTSKLKELKPNDLKKALKEYNGRELFVEYNGMNYSERHSKVGRAMFKAVCRASGSSMN